MLTLRNNSRAAKPVVRIQYEYGLDVVNGSTVIEDDNGLLAGFRVYYSLTGAPGTWHHIPDFDGTNSGPRWAVVTLASPWEVGSNLYIIWTDDNAIGGGLSFGGVEGPNALDNFWLDFDATSPPSITTPPHGITIDNCLRTNLEVVAECQRSLQYQWFHDGTPIFAATNSSLLFSNATLLDIGDYFVRVSNSAGAVDSDLIHVTVNDQPPTLISALLRSNLTTVTLNFSHGMDAENANDKAFYHVHALDGGQEFDVASASLSTDNTVTLTLAGPLSATKNYYLEIDENVRNCAGLPVTGGEHVALRYELCLLSLERTIWQYNTNAADLGVVWRSDPTYDDSASNGWSTGLSVFDGKIPTNRPQIGPFAVNTFLPLHNPNYDGGTDDIPVYYFRTHFNLPTDPSEVTSLYLWTLSDDFDVEWLNHFDTPLNVRSGLLTNADLFAYGGGSMAVSNAAVEGPFSVSPTNLAYGDNLICAKEFQINATSSDITFGLELVAIVNSFRAPQPTLSLSWTGSELVITWTPDFGTLWEADTVDAPAGAWSVVNPQTSGSAKVLISETVAQKFYTVRR